MGDFTLNNWKKICAWIFGLAVGQGAMIMTGHLVGMGNNGEVYKSAFGYLKTAIVVDGAMAVILAAFGKLILGIFTQDGNVVKTGYVLLLITILIEPARAVNLVIGNMLRGTGDVRYPVIMGILSMWVISVPLCYLLGIFFKLGLMGVWIAYAADEWIRGIINIIRWKSRLWERMYVYKEKYYIFND